MAGYLQHNLRALIIMASSPMPVMDGHDAVSSLRKQLRHQQQAHRKLQTMLQNQALAIETFQSKWQMAGQEARAFIARTRAQSEDFAHVQSLPQSSDSRTVLSVNMMVHFDHVLMHYKTNAETMLARRRIRCVRGSSMPSLKSPAFVRTNCNKHYDSKYVRRSMQMQNLPERGASFDI